MNTILNIFLLGLSFGWGPCLASCGPLLLAYIAGSKKNPFKSFFAYLIFSFSRVLVYLVLGLLVYFFGRFVFEHLVSFFKVSLIAAGIFVMLLAVLILLGKNINLSTCAFLHKHMLERDRKSLIILGLVSGIMPCAPLVSILIYAGLIAHNPFENLTYILVFGLGTSLSPLVLLSVLAGFIPRIILNAKEIYVKVFNFICALIMLVLGLQLIRRAF